MLKNNHWIDWDKKIVSSVFQKDQFKIDFGKFLEICSPMRYLLRFFLAIKVGDESLTLPPPLDPSAPIAESGRNCSD